MKLPPGSECPEGYYFTHHCCGGAVNCEPYAIEPQPDGSFEPCAPGYSRIVIISDLDAEFTAGTVHCVPSDDRLAVWKNRGVLSILQDF